MTHFFREVTLSTSLLGRRTLVRGNAAGSVALPLGPRFHQLGGYAQGPIFTPIDLWLAAITFPLIISNDNW